MLNRSREDQARKGARINEFIVNSMAVLPSPVSLNADDSPWETPHGWPTSILAEIWGFPARGISPGYERGYV
jgi:hypothetical protein